MWMTFTLLASLIIGSAALAIPTSADRYATRVAARGESRTSNLVQKVESITHESYSPNWAGAIHSEGANTFTAVTGTFTVPTFTGSDGSASAWVGIDGASCGAAILQTGVDFNLNGGQVSYDAWYEWFPAAAGDFSNINISAGDVVTLTVTADSTTSGSAVIENTTTGQTVTQQLTSSSALCEQDVEWVVEDFKVNGGLVPFANFGSVTFSDASATTAGGSVSPAGASISDIEQNGQVLTTTTVDGNDVTIAYA